MMAPTMACEVETGKPEDPNNFTDDKVYPRDPGVQDQWVADSEQAQIMEEYRKQQEEIVRGPSIWDDIKNAFDNFLDRNKDVVSDRNGITITTKGR